MSDLKALRDNLIAAQAHANSLMRLAHEQQKSIDDLMVKLQVLFDSVDTAYTNANMKTDIDTNSQI